jgi:Arc/MetJ-type ribon-helix-helix transcriptional regulator
MARKAEKMVALNVKVPESTADAIDAWRREQPGKILSRSDVIREALRRMFEEHKRPTKKTNK